MSLLFIRKSVPLKLKKMDIHLIFSTLRVSINHLSLCDQLSVIRNFIYTLQLSPSDSRVALDSAYFPNETQVDYCFEY